MGMDFGTLVQRAARAIAECDEPGNPVVSVHRLQAAAVLTALGLDDFEAAVERGAATFHGYPHVHDEDNEDCRRTARAVLEAALTPKEADDG